MCTHCPPLTSPTKQPLLTCALGRPRANIIGEDCATADVVALHVDHQKMVPLPKTRNTDRSAPQEVSTHSLHCQHEAHALDQAAAMNKTDSPAFLASANLTGLQKTGPHTSLPPSEILSASFCKGPDGKRFRLCSSHGLCHYSTLRLQCESSHRQDIK